MKFSITGTHNLTKMVWVEERVEEKTGLIELLAEGDLFDKLGELGLWNGPTKVGLNFLAWEFSPILEADVRKLLEIYYTEKPLGWEKS